VARFLKLVYFEVFGVDDELGGEFFFFFLL
jgi:hypothetical protein